MKLRSKYNIDVLTWQKLLSFLKLQLVWYPLIFSVLAGVTWAFLEDPSWMPAVAVTGLILYLLVIVFIRVWFVRSKFTIFFTFVAVSSFEAFFIITSAACAYRFWGISGFVIQNSLLLVSCIFLSIYYYAYWEKVWASHATYNETVALDMENGRYDFLNNFDTSEDIVKKTPQPKYSQSEMMSMLLKISPVGGAIYLIFSKFGDRTTPLIIGWIISIPFILFFLKYVVTPFHMFKKLSYYEKKIGKPIINGLLTPPRDKKVNAEKKNSSAIAAKKKIFPRRR